MKPFQRSDRNVRGNNTHHSTGGRYLCEAFSPLKASNFGCHERMIKAELPMRSIRKRNPMGMKLEKDKP